jgi:uncharacterized protein (DUF58 family)
MPTATPDTPEAQEILKRIRRIELRTRNAMAAAFSGQYRSVFKGRGMNFEEVREYQPGDEVRFIEWNVTARIGEVRGEAYVKKFTEERELTLLLLVDISASGIFGSTGAKRELAAEVAAVLAFSAVQNNDKVGLLLFTDRNELFIPPGRGRGHALRLIREILFYQPASERTDVAQALRSAIRLQRHRSIMVMLSDFQTPPFDKDLATAARKHDVIAMQTLDPVEETLPDAGTVIVEDAESGELLRINTSDSSIREQYAARAQTRAASLRDTFRSKKVDHLILRTGVNYIPVLRTFFLNRERRLASPA